MAKKTVLYDRHVALGARMVEFAGWLLPVQYPAGPKEEHQRVRRAAGIFDIDHMGQIIVSGPDAVPLLERVMTASISSIPDGAAQYSLMCYYDGGVVDDTFIYRLGDEYWVIVNASNNDKDTRWLEAHLRNLEARVQNVSQETYMLALQGPQAEQVLQPLCKANLSQLPHRHVVRTAVSNIPTVVSRTGYTGEDGFELYFEAEAAPTIWDALMEAGQQHELRPIGLAARDSLRLEAALPLYGQEISAELNPIQARLGWAAHLEKDFVGREALLKASLEGTKSRLVGFRMIEGGVPRHGYPLALEGKEVGFVTSGGYAPTLDAFIGLGYVPTERSRVGQTIQIEIHGKLKSAQIVRLPFYRAGKRT